MGPLDFIFQALAQKQREEDAMRLPPRQDQLTPQNMSMFQLENMRQQEPSRPTPRFRDPQQAGPSPPVSGPLAQMFGRGPRG